MAKHVDLVALCALAVVLLVATHIHAAASRAMLSQRIHLRPIKPVIILPPRPPAPPLPFSQL